jgi:hypothetical protein
MLICDVSLALRYCLCDVSLALRYCLCEQSNRHNVADADRTTSCFVSSHAFSCSRFVLIFVPLEFVVLFCDVCFVARPVRDLDPNACSCFSSVASFFVFSFSTTRWKAHVLLSYTDKTFWISLLHHLPRVKQKNHRPILSARQHAGRSTLRNRRF